jgi:hypothetical protein
MKMLNQRFDFMPVNGILYILSLFVFTTTATADNKDIPTEFIGSDYVWGEETNEIRAGLACANDIRDQTQMQLIQVLILTPKTNAVYDYVKPPNEKFARCELLNSNGTVMAPMRGKALAGELPQSIREEDLPKTPKFGRNNSLLAGALPLFQNNPMELKRFVIQDVYPIKTEGDYTLTVWPVIYHFSTNGQFVTRLDLLPVSRKVHLRPLRKEE